MSVNTAGKTTGAAVTDGEITSAVPVKDDRSPHGAATAHANLFTGHGRPAVIAASKLGNLDFH
ncbi:hypothetical protein [Streptomyces botrytidirepellens]|uniref:Uncharacterized protein n=1 Tax=Streptomyces botrytidirepellens TaxID=2486417 RepID=A0A3M8WYU6_9ACTN|nr:hypothetical protein [Streptomyces botrytidirepellens]RNG35352.1 hypothetical protein EEJ42_04290 [Streptomyces botrytidirepellens]